MFSLGQAVLDFRSDTVTRPSAGMREAMARAEVGDDVFREDATMRELEERVAALFGREAALFVPSGTMANLIGTALHCGRGDEVILERRTHSFAYEVGGGMRQVGVLAACGLYALEHNLPRLQEDHDRAKKLAHGLRRVLDGRHRMQEPETNMVMVHTDCQATT